MCVEYKSSLRGSYGSKEKNYGKKVIRGLNKASKSHANQAKKLKTVLKGKK